MAADMHGQNPSRDAVAIGGDASAELNGQHPQQRVASSEADAEPRVQNKPTALFVELVIQQRASDTEIPATDLRAYTLLRSMHRVPVGTTIREFLGAHQHEANGPDADLIAAIDEKQLGLSRFGKRAWLDDPILADDRIEIMQPILADAKAARFERVAQSRAKKQGRRKRA